MSFLRQKLEDLFNVKTAAQLDVGKPNPYEGIFWGGGYLPHEAANTHFCFMGATGSGKTVSIRLLLQTVLPFIGKGGNALDHRALIYDAKKEMMPILKGIRPNLPCKVKSLNPFDDDGYAWDLAKDIQDRAHAHELATILIPPDTNSYQPFFGDAARHLLEGVITALMLKVGDTWTFRDLMYAMGKRERIIEILDLHAETRELIPLYFGNEETVNNIMSTIATKLKSYKIIASLWHRAAEKVGMVSLTDWLKSRETREKEKNPEPNNYILLLGYEETCRTAINAINQAIFNRAAQLIDSQENIDRSIERSNVKLKGEGELDKRRHWIILDEVRNIGRLEGLRTLMTKGRSKGAAVVLGFQDIKGMRAVYGDNEAEELVGQCSHYSVFRLQGPETVKWAAGLFMESELEEEYLDPNISHSPVGVTYGMSSRMAYREIKNLTTGQIIEMAPTNWENGLEGYYLSSHIINSFGRPYYWHVIEGDKLFRPSNKVVWLDELEPQAEKIRDAKFQKLDPWTDEERNVLGLGADSRAEKIALLKAAAKRFENTAKEIAELVYYENRHEPNTREREELFALGEDGMAIFAQTLNDLFAGHKKDKGKGGYNDLHGVGNDVTTFTIERLD